MNCFKCKNLHEELTYWTCFGEEWNPKEQIDCPDFKEDKDVA